VGGEKENLMKYVKTILVTVGALIGLFLGPLFFGSAGFILGPLLGGAVGEAIFEFIE